MMEIGYWSGWKECHTLPANPNRITGEGRMRIRGRDKAAARDRKKWKKAHKAAKESRRKNRHK